MCLLHLQLRQLQLQRGRIMKLKHVQRSNAAVVIPGTETQDVITLFATYFRYRLYIVRFSYYLESKGG